MKGIPGTRKLTVESSLSHTLNRELEKAYNQGWDDALIDMSRLLQIRMRNRTRKDENNGSQTA